MREELIKKLSDYIKKVGQDKAYITYTENGLTVYDGILFMEDGRIYVISNNFKFNGSQPNSTKWMEYGRYSWCIAKSEEYLRKVVIKEDQQVISKEEICELLGIDLNKTLIINYKSQTAVI